LPLLGIGKNGVVDRASSTKTRASPTVLSSLPKANRKISAAKIYFSRVVMPKNATIPQECGFKFYSNRPQLRS
jgi:hypothetical protein